MARSLKKLIAAVFCLVLLFELSSCSVNTKSAEQTGFSMGSLVGIKLYGKNSEAVENANLLAEVVKTDERISKNYEGSDIYRVNSSGEHGETVSSKTYDELRSVCDVYSESHGKAAALSGALTELWGFDTDEFRLPSEDEILSAKEKCGDDKLIFDDGKKVYIPDGAKLNLGSAGKGIALDEAVKRIDEINSQGGKITGAVISVGGSVATYGLPKKGKSWNVGIRDPYKTENDYFAVLSLTDAFISTSGDYEKRFTAEDGKTYFHILDLTTGYPVQTELTSVTIKAPTGLLSDALSTLCFILGKEESLPILEKYNADAVFVYKDRTVFATDGIKPYLKITNGDYSLV